jgi:hypothetical protein
VWVGRSRICMCAIQAIRIAATADESIFSAP